MIAHALASRHFVNILVGFLSVEFCRFFGIMCILKTERRNIMTCLQTTVAAMLLVVLLVHAGKILIYCSCSVVVARNYVQPGM